MYMHTYTSVCVYMCICVYIYIYIHNVMILPSRAGIYFASTCMSVAACHTHNAPMFYEYTMHAVHCALYTTCSAR